MPGTALLEQGTYVLNATHLGWGIDLVGTAQATGGTLAPGKAYLLILRTTSLHFVFPFGTLVSCGRTPSAVAEDLIPELTEFVRSPHPQIRDEFQLVVAATEKDKVEFGRVTVSSSDLERLAVVAASLAQSNSLEHYENVAIELTNNSSDLTDRMAVGKMPPTGAKMLSFIGKSLAIRRELVSQLSVLDPPESIWEVASLDLLYHALRNNFEIQQRMRVVEHKLDLIKETAHLVVSLNESRRSHFLELIIIFLIAVEIVLYVIGT